jgi:hypothetical protein
MDGLMNTDVPRVATAVPELKMYAMLLDRVVLIGWSTSRETGLKSTRIPQKLAWVACTL